VDEIVVADDGSTDRAEEVCRSFPEVSTVLPWPESFFDEGLDRNMVLGLAKGTQPDWILMMDIDGVFQDGIVSRIGDMMAQDEYAVWDFHMLRFWHGKTHFRMDGPWGHETLNHVHPRLFRDQPGLRYPFQRLHGAHILGALGKAAVSDVRIRHYGYARPDRAREKHQLYRRVDPQGDYRHLVDETGLVLVEYCEPAAPA